MEKENVLEIEFKELWDNNFAWRVTEQNEEILGRNVFKDEELNVESFESPEFRKAESKLFIKGHFRTYDNNIQICTAEEKALIEEKVKAINEKYGVTWQGRRTMKTEKEIKEMLSEAIKKQEENKKKWGKGYWNITEVWTEDLTKVELLKKILEG